MAGVFDVEHAEAGEYLPCAPGAGGQHAVHHVNAAGDGADDVIGFAHAHEVARFVLRELVGGILKAAEHRLLPFAHGKAADGVAFKADVLQGLGGGLAQVFFQPALLDAEERVSRARAKGVAGAARPAHGELHRLGDIGAGGGQGGAFIKAHDNVRAKQALDLHAALWREHVFGAVNMGFEGHAFFGEFAQAGQRHDLKAA